jgi:hypothetical protein
MKTTLTIILLNFCFTLGISQNSIVKGKIVPVVESEYDFIKENVKVLICTGCDEFATELNSDLTFEFENLEVGTFELWIEPYSKYSIILESGTLDKDEILIFEIPVAFSCEYDQSENDKTCPICQKQNRVIPVEYGFINSKPQKSYTLGCIKTDCDPNWYCKRDKHLF